MKKTKLGILGLGHLMVDFMTIYLINYQYQNYDFKWIAFFFIIYNLIAFGIQPIVGYIADEYNKHFEYSIAGLLLPVLALLLLRDYGIVAIIVATIGNAMYHVGGGVLSMNLFKDKAMPAGVFVAPGAIGVFLGVYLAQDSTDFMTMLVLLGNAMIVLIYIFFKDRSVINESKPLHPKFMWITGLVFGIVFIRGFIGSLLLFTWKGDSFMIGFILVLCVVLGKFFGGILGDQFGYKKIGIFGLVVSLPLLTLGYNVPVFGMIGAMFFNVTMAITLFLIIDVFGKYKGFAFGLTTLSLVIAFLPKLLGMQIDYGILYIALLVGLVLLGAYGLNKAVNIYEEGVE